MGKHFLEVGSHERCNPTFERQSPQIAGVPISINLNRRLLRRPARGLQSSATGEETKKFLIFAQDSCKDIQHSYTSKIVCRKRVAERRRTTTPPHRRAKTAAVLCLRYPADSPLTAPATWRQKWNLLPGRAATFCVEGPDRDAIFNVYWTRLF